MMNLDAIAAVISTPFGYNATIIVVINRSPPRRSVSPNNSLASTTGLRRKFPVPILHGNPVGMGIDTV